ncbi:MAG: DNA polymerase III subunit delta [Gaiellaceae bacterium]
MAAEELRPVYFLTGSDRPKVRRALARLRARFDPESVELLAADATSGEETVAALNALGLFGSGHLVAVEGVERWKKADVEAVAEYLGSPAAGSVLALLPDEPMRDDALAKLVARHGKVLAYDVPKPRDPTVWVRGEFARLEADAKADAARRLVEIAGDDVMTLSSEIDKITTWAGGEPISAREVESLAVPAHGAEPWALTDAWGARDVGAALAACEVALEQREPFILCLALASHAGRVRAAQVFGEQGLGARDLAKRLRIKEYPARKALAHAENYTRDELDAAIIRLAQLDAALKGASRLSAELELERALVEITVAREPAGTRA